MRLASQFLHILRQPSLLLSEIKPNCLLTQLRHKHRPVKKVEEISERKPECLQPCNVPKKSIWNIFRREKKPVRECETVQSVSEEQAERDVKNISEMGGQVYRTCGTAYLLQKEQHQQPEEPVQNPEDHVLEEMMKDPSLKGQCDPMPPFKSVEIRLIELNERRLHPLYKKLMSIPKTVKPRPSTASPTTPYKTRSGPVLPEEFPPHLKIVRETYEKKNIFLEFKRAQPPQQMLARMVEMKNNERPQLKPSKDKDYSKKC